MIIPYSARSHMGKDNITVIVLDIPQVEAETQTDQKRKKQSIFKSVKLAAVELPKIVSRNRGEKR